MDPASSKLKLAELFGERNLPAMPARGSAIAIYGAGNCGQKTSQQLRKIGYKVIAFLDAKADQLGDVQGIPCLDPRSPDASSIAQSGIPVLVAVFNFASNAADIEKVLRAVGFCQVLPYGALYGAFPEQLEPSFWLATRDYWEKNRIHIERALDLWQDDKSREIFLQLVDLRLSGDLQLLCAPDMEYQYFPADIAPPSQPLRFVDGGAFIGDTLGATISRFEVEKIAAFEPDSSHFRVLDHWVKKNGLISKTSLYQSGLGFKRSKKRFQQTGDASSAFSSSGDDMVEVVALDEVLDGFAPNFIKLDIEGAEVEALKGGENVIRRHGPRIAACVYHLPSHLWEVPLLLRHLLPSHTLHLRYHGFNGFDAVAYAIENEKRDF